MILSLKPQHKVIYERIYEDHKEESNFLYFVYRGNLLWEFKKFIYTHKACHVVYDLYV